MAKRKAFRVVLVVEPTGLSNQGITDLEELVNDLITKGSAAASMTAESALKRMRVLETESWSVIDRPGDIY